MRHLLPLALLCLSACADPAQPPQGPTADPVTPAPAPNSPDPAADAAVLGRVTQYTFKGCATPAGVGCITAIANRTANPGNDWLGSITCNCITSAAHIDLYDLRAQLVWHYPVGNPVIDPPSGLPLFALVDVLYFPEGSDAATPVVVPLVLTSVRP